MARRKRTRPFRVVSAVKALARERIGTPPPEKVVPDRKKKTGRKEKHKPTLRELLQSSE